jgi:hypothetical protein
MKEPSLTNPIPLISTRGLNSNRAHKAQHPLCFQVENIERQKKYQKLLFLYLETFLIFAELNKNFNYEIF